LYLKKVAISMGRNADRSKWRRKIDGEVGFASLPTIFSLAIG